MSIGTQLRQAREEQSLSLDQVAQETHIRMRYLEALEADQFDVLPSTAQVRGFLRIYSDYLKLDAKKLLAILENDTQLNQSSEEAPPPSQIVEQELTSSDGIFTEIGQKLKSQRELMGLSLDDVERHSHIRLHYLRALEEGDISHLPSPVQGRGMLSNYATFLGLDTEAILLRFADGLQAKLYDRQVARKGSTTTSSRKEAATAPSRPSQLKRFFSMDLFIGGFLILFLLGFTVWGALRISKLHAVEAPSPTAPPVSQILLSTQAESLTATPELTLEVAALTPSEELLVTPVITETLEVNQTNTPAAIGSTPPISNAPVQIYVVAHQLGWMRVTIDGEIAFEGRVVPGSAYSYAGNDRIELLTGNAASIQVYFNQQDLGLLGGFGEVVERIFSIEGIQTPTPAVPPTQTPAPTSTSTQTPTATATSLPATPTSTPRP
jgi:cytoskeleton protein RodZ